MADIEDTGRRHFLTFTGKAGLSTLVAKAIGVNLGMVDNRPCAVGRAKGHAVSLRDDQ